MVIVLHDLMYVDLTKLEIVITCGVVDQCCIHYPEILSLRSKIPYLHELG